MTNYNVVLRGNETIEKHIAAKNYNDALGQALLMAHQLTLANNTPFNIARLDVA